MLSVIIPTDRQTQCSVLEATLASLSKMKNLEVICIDKAVAHSRAERLNLGFHQAQGQIILFHHPRSFIEPHGIQDLIDRSLDPNLKVFWGGFTHKFDMDHPLLKFTSWYSNRIRGNKNGVLYLDHCIFFDRRLWKKDLPTVDIFEDTLLSYEFRKSAMPMILPYLSTTSAIRFHKNGIWKQAFLNQVLKAAFHLKVPHTWIYKLYEKQLGLNSNYPKGHR